MTARLSSVSSLAPSASAGANLQTYLHQAPQNYVAAIG